MSTTDLLPAGYARRAPSESDVDALLRLVHAYDVATIGHPDFTADDVRDELADPRAHPTKGSWVVTAPDGGFAGWAQVVEQGVGTDGLVSTEADVTVHPEAPDQVGRHLLACAVRRVAEIAAERQVARAQVDSFVMTMDARAARWFADLDFAPVRRFSRLEVELTGREKVPPRPPGVTVRVADSEKDLPIVHRVLVESFADHFGAVTEPYETWARRMATTSTVDRSQWWLAEVGGEPAGLVIGNRQCEDENSGWVKNLGVLPQYRGRGLGRLLLQHALADMARRGRKRAGLGADTRNESGALALYESVGFTVTHSADVWRRMVPAELAGLADLAGGDEDGGAA